MEKGVKSRQPAMSVSLSNSLRVKGLCEEHNTLAHDVPWARRLSQRFYQNWFDFRLLANLTLEMSLKRQRQQAATKLPSPQENTTVRTPRWPG